MSKEELETEALKLSPQARARLAERLLRSLENLIDEGSAQLWAGGSSASRRIVGRRDGTAGRRCVS